MAIEFEIPPESKAQETKLVRVTADTHTKLTGMAKAHDISITKFMTALTNAHYAKNPEKYGDEHDKE